MRAFLRGLGWLSWPGWLGWLGLWLACALPPAALAQNLLQKMPPSVQHGMEAYAEERFADAQAAFEEANNHLPLNAQLEFNRGTALYKREEYSAALQSFSRARELDDGKLRGDIFYNMGNTYAAMGKKGEAIASFRQALRANPKDAMARNNLEFLLTQPLSPPHAPGQKDDADNHHDDAQQDGAQHDGAQQDGAQNGSSKGNDDKAADNRPDNADSGADDAGTSADKPRPDNSSAASAGDTQGGPPTQGASPPQPADLEGEGAGDNTNTAGAHTESALPRGKRQLSKEDADRMLDAFGMDEKSYEPWRFQKKTPVESWQYEQDW